MIGAATSCCVSGSLPARKIESVSLGDSSTTQEWETAGEDFWNRHYSGRYAVNFGTNSDLTQHVLWRLDQGILKTIHPKLVILMIGTNNAFAGDSAEEIAEGVEAVVQKLQPSVHDSQILLLGILPSGKRPDSAPGVRTLAGNAIFRNIADGTMIHYLDIGSAFVNRDGTMPNR